MVIPVQPLVVRPKGERRRPQSYEQKGTKRRSNLAQRVSAGETGSKVSPARLESKPVQKRKRGPGRPEKAPGEKLEAVIAFRDSQATVEECESLATALAVKSPELLARQAFRIGLRVLRKAVKPSDEKGGAK